MLNKIRRGLIFRINPRRFIDYRRFDIAAKLLYARYYTEGRNLDWARELYLEHVKVWNGFHERQPKKDTPEQYLNSFHSVIEAMRSKSRSFKYLKSPVPVASGGQLFDGAHRVASAVATGNRLYAYRKKVAISEYSADFFKNRTENVKGGLGDQYLDAMALEYISAAHKNQYIAVFFPVGGIDMQSARREISAIGDIVYEKSDVYISEKGSKVLIRQLYAGEAWNREDNPTAIESKSRGCFPAAGSVQVVLFETTKKHTEVIKLKARLREMANVGKHSVHITDTRSEAELVGKIFFNHNSLHLINHAKDWRLPAKFGEMFEEFQRIAPPSEHRAIDSSSVLAVYGLRDANDIDYLHDRAQIEDIPGRISDHNPHSSHYDTSVEEIIANPKNHFYYCGVKFASLDVVRRMKVIRGESKDKKDVALIEEISQ